MVTSVTLNAEEQHVSTTRVSSKQASAQPVLATSLGTSVQVLDNKDKKSRCSNDPHTLPTEIVCSYLPFIINHSKCVRYFMVFYKKMIAQVPAFS